MQGSMHGGDRHCEMHEPSRHHLDTPQTPHFPVCYKKYSILIITVSQKQKANEIRRPQKDSHISLKNQTEPRIIEQTIALNIKNLRNL